MIARVSARRLQRGVSGSNPISGVMIPRPFWRSKASVICEMRCGKRRASNFGEKPPEENLADRTAGHLF